MFGGPFVPHLIAWGLERNLSLSQGLFIGKMVGKPLGMEGPGPLFKPSVGALSNGIYPINTHVIQAVYGVDY